MASDCCVLSRAHILHKLTDHHIVWLLQSSWTLIKRLQKVVAAEMIQFLWEALVNMYATGATGNNLRPIDVQGFQ